jgi:glucose-6-phosphate isomerase
MPADPSFPDKTALAEAWNIVAAQGMRPGAHDIRAMFAADPGRASRYTAVFDDLAVDFSKTSLDDAAIEALHALSRAAGLSLFRDRLFEGRLVNVTEGRAAMHMALRDGPDAALSADTPDTQDDPAGGREDASALATAELGRMRDFVAGVHGGLIRGATGAAFTDVLNIGIGGSDLGPLMATEALTLAHGPKLRARFLSNVDGHGFAAAIRGLDPARTLVLVASKTFTTQETATNAAAARAWLAASLGEAAVGDHFAALSTNLAAVAKFGIRPERVFGFRDWVGGRFSLWSAVGLSIALAAGFPAFQAMLDGAAAMDAHFRSAPFATNLPVLLALAGIWHVDVCGYRAQCVLAYDDRLRRFPAYLQQLEMESNGKSIGLDGRMVEHLTCPVVFGEPGTNAQHSFMQLIHQGTSIVPVDFILAANPDHDRPDAHRILAAHAFAQSEALLRGRTLAEVKAEMRDNGASDATIAAVAPHRVFDGNRPSITILSGKLDAFALGRLIALYEHKVAVQGCIWGINSFDQWGVELGKALAAGLLPDLQLHAPEGDHDISTNALIARFKALRGEE